MDSLAQVTTNDLNLRADAGTDTQVLTSFDEGVLLYVVGGPIADSGYEWYQVLALDEATRRGYPFGWVAAAAQDGTAWLASVDDRCPVGAVGARKLADIDPLIGLACFGSDVLTFEGTLYQPEARCGAEPNVVIEPNWIDPTCLQDWFITGPEVTRFPVPWSLSASIDPEVLKSGSPGPLVRPSTWLHGEVQGSFDHPASAECHWVAQPGESRIPPEELAILLCRSVFVLSALPPAEQ